MSGTAPFVPGSPQPRSTATGPLSVHDRRRLQPPRLAKAAIAAAAWQLPPAHRTRYRLEFYGELYGMSRARQVRYAAALFVHSWSLAIALKEPDPAQGRTHVRKDVRCVLGIHTYARRYAHDADATGSHSYLECRRCGKFKDAIKHGYGYCI